MKILKRVGLRADVATRERVVVIAADRSDGAVLDLDEDSAVCFAKVAGSVMGRHGREDVTRPGLGELSTTRAPRETPEGRTVADVRTARFTLRVVTEVTEAIRVSVETRFIEEQSDPATDRYAFAYHVVISNESQRTVQLLRRHWFITVDGGNPREVEGPGVIGEQPVLEPGERHAYTSGAILEMPSGSMRGYYEMRDTDGESVRVRIPEFTLRMPRTLH